MEIVPLKDTLSFLNGEFLIAVVTFGVAAYLGLMVFLRNPRSWTHRFFFILTAVISGYTIIHFLSLHTPEATASSQLFWIRADMAIGALFGPVLLLLVLVFPHKTFTVRIRYVIPLVTLASATVFLSFTPLVFESITYPVR